nr:retrovirus-related Pol polyprotein from transposon TNT 1-94 [Tanacetum cinerariifolium]
LSGKYTLLAVCQMVHCAGGLLFLTAGKENEVNILKSIDEGSFQIGTFRETLAEGDEGETIHDYYVQFAKLINDMQNIKMTMSKMQLNSKFVNNMLPEWGRFGRLNRGQGNNARETSAAGYGGAQNRVGNTNPGQERQITCYNCNGIGHIARNYTQPKRPQNLEYFKEKMLLMQAQENGVALDEEQLLFIIGGQNNVDDDVDEQPV